MDRMEKGVGGGSRGGCRRRICRQWLLATGAKRLNEAGKDKASNKLDIRETERERGLRSCSKKAVIWHSSPRSVPEDWAGFCRFIWFVPPPVTSWAHFSSSLYAHIRTHFVFSRETQAFTYKSLTVSQLLRFPSRSLFVYFTPSIMQGLISQSRFELRHASAKERRAELLCWGKFPLHTSLEVDRSPLYAARFNLQTEQREQEDRGRTRSGEGS